MTFPVHVSDPALNDMKCPCCDVSWHDCSSPNETQHQFSVHFNKSEKSDLTLIVGDQSFFVHKFVLCASSEYFEKSLSGRWKNRRESPNLDEDQIFHPVFDTFLRSLYNIDINLTGENVAPLYQLAGFYLADNLKSRCIHFMTSHMASNVSNVVSWLGVTWDDPPLESELWKFILLNFENVMSASQAKYLSLELILKALGSLELVVENEYSLFRNICKWVDSQEPERGSIPSDEDVIELFSLIRYPLMSSQQLASLENEPIVIKHRQFFTERIELAKRIRNNEVSAADEVDAVDQPHFVSARYYTSDDWSRDFTLANLHLTYASVSSTDTWFSTRGLCSEEDRNEMSSTIRIEYPQYFDAAEHHVWKKDNRDVTYELECREGARKVQISFLIFGQQDGVPYVKKVVDYVTDFEENPIAQFSPFIHLVTREELYKEGSCFMFSDVCGSLRMRMVFRPLKD